MNNSDWISVEDELPEENEDVLITQHEYKDKAKPRYYLVAFICNNNWFQHTDERGDEEIYAPTHWMPILEPEK